MNGEYREPLFKFDCVARGYGSRPPNKYTRIKWRIKDYLETLWKAICGHNFSDDYY